MYKLIKKEHLFIFLALFTALVLFTYFNEYFNYTGLTTKNTCTDQGYQCCIEGQGTNYFSLDNTCNNNEQCWTSCTENIKETNVMTTSAVINDIWSPIKDFFIKLFSREVRGGVGAQCTGKPTLFTILEEVGGSHASKFISGNDAYTIPVCSISSQFQQAQDNDPNKYLLLKLSSITNAHVEKKELTNYNTLIYIKPVGTGSIECSYSEMQDSECLFSISSDTSAHVGACESNNQNIPVYDIKIECKINRPDGGTSNNDRPTCDQARGSCRPACFQGETEEIEFS